MYDWPFILEQDLLRYQVEIPGDNCHLRSGVYSVLGVLKDDQDNILFCLAQCLRIQVVMGMGVLSTRTPVEPQVTLLQD